MWQLVDSSARVATADHNWLKQENLLLGSGGWGVKDQRRRQVGFILRPSLLTYNSIILPCAHLTSSVHVWKAFSSMICRWSLHIREKNNNCDRCHKALFYSNWSLVLTFLSS